MIIEKQNQGLFIRRITEVEFHSNGRSLTTYREYRPWVYGLFLGLLTGFAIWSWVVVQVGEIELAGL